MSSHVFLSPEAELFFVKTHIIHGLAETTLEAYCQINKPLSCKRKHSNYLHHQFKEMMENANIFSCFLKWIQHDKGRWKKKCFFKMIHKVKGYNLEGPLITFSNLYKLCLCFWIILIFIWMIFDRQLSEGSFYFLGWGFLRDSQCFVVIPSDQGDYQAVEEKTQGPL